MSKNIPFHLAFPVSDLEVVRDFYTRVLKCQIGRESERWIDFNFFGHQITTHLDESSSNEVTCNAVDSKQVPVRHFGAILQWDDWDVLVEVIRSNNIEFYVAPYTRFEGEIGEQKTFFIQDPCGNFIEFKCFKDEAYIFRN